MTDELLICQYYFIIGLIIAISYDPILIARRTIGHNRISCGVEDIVYWFFVTIIIYYCIYILNNMRLRYYIIISLVLGIIVYRIGIGRIVVKVVSDILIFVKNKVLKKAYKKVKILYIHHRIDKKDGIIDEKK